MLLRAVWLFISYILWVSVPHLLNTRLHSLWGCLWLTELLLSMFPLHCIMNNGQGKPCFSLKIKRKKFLKWERNYNRTYIWTILIFHFQRGFTNIVSFYSYNKLWRLIFTTFTSGEIQQLSKVTKKILCKSK